MAEQTFEILQVHLTQEDAERAFAADRFKFLSADRLPVLACSNAHIRVTYTSYPRTLRLVSHREFNVALIDKTINSALAPNLLHRVRPLLEKRRGDYHYV